MTDRVPNISILPYLASIREQPESQNLALVSNAGQTFGLNLFMLYIYDFIQYFQEIYLLLTYGLP